MDSTARNLAILSLSNGSSSGGIDYSTEEQNTGIKWIDGKPIYQKTITIPNTLTDSAYVTWITDTPNIENIVNYEIYHSGKNFVYINPINLYEMATTVTDNAVSAGSKATIWYTKN